MSLAKIFQPNRGTNYGQSNFTNWGKSLTAKELRTFQQQFETAEDRVLDKGEREAYDLLFDQLSGYWQKKVVKEERT